MLLTLKKGKQTSGIVVCANKSEHNPEQASLKTPIRNHAKENRSSLAVYILTRTCTTYPKSNPSHCPENWQFSRRREEVLGGVR